MRVGPTLVTAPGLPDGANLGLFSLHRKRQPPTLSYDDVTHYGKIVVALKETIRLMSEIDEVIPSWPIE